MITCADLDDIRITAYRDGWDLALSDRRVRPGLSVTAGGDLPDLLLRGPEAITVLGRVLPRMAGFAGSRTEVRDAVEVLEDTNHASAIVGQYFRHHHAPLKKAAPSLRLALEMAAHEESEREALTSELKLLERQWKEADELAKITDSLAVSDEVQERIG